MVYRPHLAPTVKYSKNVSYHPRLHWKTVLYIILVLIGINIIFLGCQTINYNHGYCKECHHKLHLKSWVEGLGYHQYTYQCEYCPNFVRVNYHIKEK